MGCSEEMGDWDVLDELGTRIPQITVQAFLDYLAPPRPDFDIDATMETLMAHPDGILSSEGRWKAFDTEPKDQLGEEDEIFKPLQDIFNSVVDTVIANSNSNLAPSDSSVDFLQNTTTTPMSTDRYNATRPAAYMLVKDRVQSEAISWADILLSCEYKQKDGVQELDDNVSNCVWCMRHIMWDDPCRRATFGMTIENAMTRLWFCCRSSIFVTDAFNFITKPKSLVQVFAAFAFADKKSLGFDPTVERAPGNPSQFIITVHPNDDKRNPRRFLTKKIIASFGAVPLQGQGTRVFEAIEVDKSGNERGSVVVLKDVWTIHDRVNEGSILTRLYDDADDEDKKLVRKYFLTTICHGDVWTEPDVIDDTGTGLMRGLKIPASTGFLVQENRLAGSWGWIPTRSHLHPSNPTLKYIPKTHYRIVFKEKGITLDHVRSFPDVMTILGETVTALQLLRKLGWVHRDVSIDNILSYEGGAKLADMEYAKRICDTTYRDERIASASPITFPFRQLTIRQQGTSFFMSLEVNAGMFLFETLKISSPISVRERKKRAGDASSPIQRMAPFYYNHLHDLESLWWVAVWIVFYNNFRDPQQSNEELLPDLQEVNRQIGLAQYLFPASLDRTLRRAVSFQHSFSKACSGLPKNKKDICYDLDFLRRCIIQHYVNVQSPLPDSVNLDASGDDIYENFRVVFSCARNEYSDFTLILIADIYSKLLSTTPEIS